MLDLWDNFGTATAADNAARMTQSEMREIIKDVLEKAKIF